MFSILKAEIYKTVRNRTFLILFITAILVSIPMTGMSFKHNEVHNVLVFHKEVEDKYTQAIKIIQSKNYYVQYDSLKQNYLIASEAKDLLLPGGELHEEYGWLLNEEYDYKQYINGSYYSTDEKNVYENWGFQRILGDNAAIVIFGIIFAIYFFGYDFICRSYSIYILSGRTRGEIILGKSLAYLIFSFVLSLILIIINTFIYVPSITVLETSYIIRCISTRNILDIGFLFIPIIFPFIFRDVIKSVGFGFTIMILFFSNRAIVNIHLLDSYKNSALWMHNFSMQAFSMMSATSVMIVIVTVTCSYLIFRVSQLK